MGLQPMKFPRFLLLLLCMAIASLTGCNRVHYPINLNTASAKDLAELPGVGPKYADAIIAGRPYKTVDEVTKVKGIGPKTLEKMRDKVTVGEPAGTAAGK
jgi:competence ComEA-like helix-hairpin-helix protein